MPFWKCFYHVVWATKNRAAIIEPTFEPVIYAAIRQKATRFNSTIYAVHSVEDLIHIATTIPTSIAVSTWIGDIKGTSARAINTTFELDVRFRWQAGYGVLTFGEKRLPFVVDYINRQKEHHRDDTVYPYLEKMDDG